MTENQFDNAGEPPLPRVTVSHPMTRAAIGARWSGSSTLLRADVRQPGDEMALRSIMRAQLRLTLRWFGLLVMLLVSVVFALAFAPRSASLRIFGAPFVWVLLGVLCFPVLSLIAHQYVKRVERLESRILSLTDTRPPDRFIDRP